MCIRDRRKVDKCECKFHWCCFVVCKECRRWVDVHTCKGPPEHGFVPARVSNGAKQHHGGASNRHRDRPSLDAGDNMYNGRSSKRNRFS